MSAQAPPTRTDPGLLVALLLLGVTGLLPAGARAEKLIQTIPAPAWTGAAAGIAVDPTTDRVVIAGDTYNVISILDASSGTYTAHASTNAGTKPDGMAVNPLTGRVYVACSTASQVQAFDENGNYLGVYSLGASGAGPSGMAINPLTSNLYVANNVSGTVSVITTSTGATSTPLAPPDGSHPFAVAVNPLNNRVYVASTDASKINVLDGATNSWLPPIQMPVNAGSQGIVVNSRTGFVYTLDGAQLAVIDTYHSNAVSSLPLPGSDPVAIAINERTGRVYVSSQEATWKVYVVDGNPGSGHFQQVVNQVTLPGATGLLGLAVNPNTTQVFAALQDGRVAVLAPSGAGGAVAWGSNDVGELGNGTTTWSYVPVAVRLPSGAPVVAAAPGYQHSLALRSDGSVLAWGRDYEGELGIGSNTDSHVPVVVSMPTGAPAVAVAPGGFHSLALRSDGSVLAWGYNAAGELGNGSTTESHVPVEVSLPAGASVVAVAAGYFHSLALRSDGSVLAWGGNNEGELGNGSTTNSDVPVEVSLPAGAPVVAIAAGDEHNLALRSDGSVLAWGRDYEGQVGNGSTVYSVSVPIAVSLPTGAPVVAVAGGYEHSLALRSDGSSLAWGLNDYGELGNDSYANSNVPVSVSLPTGAHVVAVAGGDNHSLALRSDGSGLAWGYNGISSVPIPVTGLSSAAAVAGGEGYSLALTSQFIVSGINLSPYQNVPFSSTVAHFTDSDPTAADYSATIDWGDSSPVSPTTPAVSPSGGFDVLGSHTYTSRGQFNITVTVNDPDGNSASAVSTATIQTFTFSPQSGPIGTQVTLTGLGFTGATAVKFNGTASTFDVSSDTQITTSVPSGASSGPISVITPSGMVTSYTSFTVPAPSKIMFTPNHGSLGSTVSITGTGFAGATAVKFNGTDSSFAVNSDTSITGYVPSGAMTGPITVTTPAGTGTSSANFAVDFPAITSFNPNKGSVGATVNITGSAFTGASAVKFHGVSGDYIVNSDTSITATVPSGATTGPISVTSPAGIGTSATNFTVTATVPFDFNGDGKADLLWQNSATGGVLYWLMNGVQYSGTGGYIVNTATWNVVGVADFNGDGSPDIVWQNPSSGAVVVWYMNGLTYSGNAGAIAAAADPAWKVVGTPDLNGDGHPDILWQNSNTGAVLYWLMNGAQFTGQSGYIVASTDPAWRVVGTPDLNGDGSPDVLWQNPTTGGVYVWYMNGVTYSGTGTYIVTSTDPAWHVVGDPDLNGDGKPDLLWQNSTTGGVLYWIMNGAVYTDQGDYIISSTDLNWHIVGIH